MWYMEFDWWFFCQCFFDEVGKDWCGDLFICCFVVYGFWIVKVNKDIDCKIGCVVYELGVFFVVGCVGFVCDWMIYSFNGGSGVVLDNIFYYGGDLVGGYWVKYLFLVIDKDWFFLVVLGVLGIIIINVVVMFVDGVIIFVLNVVDQCWMNFLVIICDCCIGGCYVQYCSFFCFK